MHKLIVGNSGTGKSNLCKRFALNQSANVSIYDPLQSTGWRDNSQKFSDPDKFFSYIRTLQNSYVFIDEAKTLWDADQREADKILYKRRHQGLLIFLIAQRTRMVPPNARNQCSTVYAFKQQKHDADILADEYHDLLANTRTLQPGQFIASDGFSAQLYQLDYSQTFPPTYTKLDN